MFNFLLCLSVVTKKFLYAAVGRPRTGSANPVGRLLFNTFSPGPHITSTGAGKIKIKPVKNLTAHMTFSRHIFPLTYCIRHLKIFTKN